MKRKLTLGLVVFFIGVLITACGSKKSSAPAPAAKTNKEQPLIDNGKFGKCQNSGSQAGQADGATHSSGQGNFGSCSEVYEGTFRIADVDLYMEVFGYSAGQPYIPGQIPIPSDIFSRDQWGNLLTGVFQGAVQCGIGYLVGKYLSNDDSGGALECGFSTTTTTTTTNGGSTQNHAPTLNSSYPAELIVDDAEAAITLRIMTGSNGHNGDIVRFTQRSGDNGVFFNYPDRDIALVINGRSVKMETAQGVLGTFQ